MTTTELAIKAVATPAAPAAIGPYSQAIVAPPFVFISGQLPIDPATGEMDGPDIAHQAARSITNLEAILVSIGLTLADVVKTTVFLTDMADFATVNDVYLSRFDGTSFPARSAVQVVALPKGAGVEIEAIARLH